MQFEKYRVIKDYKSPYPDSISFQKGEEITIGNEFNDDPDWEDWLWCEGENNNKAWTPKQFIVKQGEKEILNTDYDAKELSIQTGEVLTVLKIVNGFGFCENSKSETGWAPIKYLSIVSNK